MSYLITEIFFSLMVTAVLGILVGWLAKSLLAARQARRREESFRRELRRSEARAGNLKSQLAEAFLVEERLRDELSRSEATPSAEGSKPTETLQAELDRRDKKIEILQLQVSQSKAAVSSEWQSLKTLKSELAERQQRLEERGKQMSGKLRSSEEAQQQLRLQLRKMKRHGDRLQERLEISQQALTEERWESAARITKLEALLEEQQTTSAPLGAEEATPAAATAGRPASTGERPLAEAALAETREVTAEESVAVEEPAVAAEPAVERVDDDLQRIHGIGPVLCRKLNKIGINRFRQIAAWSDDDLIEVAGRIKVAAGRIRRDDWIAAARKLQV